MPSTARRARLTTAARSEKSAADAELQRTYTWPSYLVHPGTILATAREVDRAWTDLLGKKTGQDTAGLQRLIATVFAQHGILPTQVRDRLTAHPVASAVSPTLNTSGT